MSDDLRLLLSARRPHGQDDADPSIASALAQAQADPALATWVAEQQRTDATLCDKLRGVQPPAGLRDRIMAGSKVSRKGWGKWFESRSWLGLRNSELLAVAAIVLLLGVASLVQQFRKDSDTTTDWRLAGAMEVARIEDGSRGIDAHPEGMDAVRAWLSVNTGPQPGALPESVGKLPIVGCSLMKWRGQPMSIVCFTYQPGRHVHLVTIERANLPDPPPPGEPEFVEKNGYATASWSEGPMAMMLIGKMEQKEIEAIFQKLTAMMLWRRFDLDYARGLVLL